MEIYFFFRSSRGKFSILSYYLICLIRMFRSRLFQLHETHKKFDAVNMRLDSNVWNLRSFTFKLARAVLFPFYSSHNFPHFASQLSNRNDHFSAQTLNTFFSSIFSTFHLSEYTKTERNFLNFSQFQQFFFHYSSRKKCAIAI